MTFTWSKRELSLAPMVLTPVDFYAAACRNKSAVMWHRLGLKHTINRNQNVRTGTKSRRIFSLDHFQQRTAAKSSGCDERSTLGSDVRTSNQKTDLDQTKELHIFQSDRNREPVSGLFSQHQVGRAALSWLDLGPGVLLDSVLVKAALELTGLGSVSPDKTNMITTESCFLASITD